MRATDSPLFNILISCVSMFLLMYAQVSFEKKKTMVKAMRHKDLYLNIVP